MTTSKNFKLALRVQKNVSSGNMHCVVSFCWIDRESFSRKDTQHGDIEYAWSTFNEDYWMQNVQCHANSYIRMHGDKQGTWSNLGYELATYNLAKCRSSQLSILAKKLDWIEKNLAKYAENHGSIATDENPFEFAEYVFRLMNVTKCEYLIMPKNDGSEYAFCSRAKDAYCLDMLRRLLVVPIVESITSEV